MSSIVTATAFIDSQTVTHFIVIYQILGRNDRRPTAVTVIIHLTDGIQCIGIRNILYRQNDFLRILTSHLEQVCIVCFQIIDTQVNDFLSFLFSNFPFTVIQSLTHPDSQCCSLCNTSTFTWFLVQIRCAGIQFGFNEFLHLSFCITWNLCLFCTVIIRDNGYTTIQPVHLEITIRTDDTYLSNQVFLYCFVGKLNIIYIFQECIATADNGIIVIIGTTVCLSHFTVGKVFITFP